uniref:DNA-3-methyladenine glycosylase I n=1 Tax=Opuntia streptacantha TaxID=393608 RepID=A0A7C9B0M1_OPUST
MSGGPRVRSLNSPDSEQRPVLVPAGNKARTVVEARKPAANKPLRKLEKSPEEKKQAQFSPGFSPPMRNLSAPSILRNHQQHLNQLMRGNLSLNASCSSDASSDSSQSRASTGKISRSSVPVRRKPMGIKLGKGHAKIERVEKVVSDDGQAAELDGIALKKRCAWVTPNTDPLHANFHDEEWGVPVHDDNKLFELLSLAVALAELTWPNILNKRNLFREVFLDFDPISVSKLNEKKICAPGSVGSTLLSEIKLRNIVENARQVCKIKDECGSFDKYIWGFMNHKPLVNKFRYPRQVPVKTSKADAISKDLVKRGFRGVGPTVVYSFMQAAGLTNDHLVTCFRFQECVVAGEGVQNEDTKVKVGEEKQEDLVKLELARVLDEVSVCSD